MQAQVRKTTICCAAILTLVIAACSAPDTDVVRHLVIAELIQRASVSESQIAIHSIRFPDQDVATVQVDILQAPAKSVDPARKFVCELRREGGRWSLETVREADNPSPP